jgi:MHS family proline/betaine transporter-like MFS transporter
VRYTALSVSYGFAVAIFGGFAPLAATGLIASTDNPLAPAFLVMAAGAISASAVLWMREPRNVPLE